MAGGWHLRGMSAASTLPNAPTLTGTGFTTVTQCCYCYLVGNGGNLNSRFGMDFELARLITDGWQLQRGRRGKLTLEVCPATENTWYPCIPVPLIPVFRRGEIDTDVLLPFSWYKT